MAGDATLMLPTQTVSEYVLSRIEDATKKIVKELNITGPYNIQYIVKGSDVMVIECEKCLSLYIYYLCIPTV